MIYNTIEDVMGLTNDNILISLTEYKKNIRKIFVYSTNNFKIPTPVIIFLITNVSHQVNIEKLTQILRRISYFCTFNSVDNGSYWIVHLAANEAHMSIGLIIFIIYFRLWHYKLQ